MKNGYKLSLAAIAASLSLVGCGSDSTSTTTVTGQFVDTYVEGLNYTCSSGTTDVTNAAGEYTCNVGDTVEFSLGGYVLGSVEASSGIVTPEILYPSDTDVISPEAMNVAQLLQTLDTDLTDDIITIDGNFTALVDANITLDDAAFDTTIIDVLTDNGLVDVEVTELVSETDAQAHLDETEFTLLLANKTFYFVGQNINDETDIWSGEATFNADLTEFTVIEGGVSGIEPISIVGDRLQFDNDTDGSYTLIGESQGDYIELIDYYSDGTIEGNTRLYFDQAKAEAYYDSLQPVPDATESALLRDMLSGNTWSSTDTTVTFNADVTSIVFGDGGTDTVSLDGMTLTHSDGYEVITIVNETTLLFSYNGVEAGGTFTLVPAQATPTPVPDATEADLRLLLEGKTLYGQSDYSAWTFNSDATEISIVDADALDNVIPPEIIAISVSGNTIIADGGATTVVAVIGEQWIDLTWTSGADTGMTDKIWYNLADLEAYYTSIGML